MKTLEVEELLDFHLDTENIVNKVVLQTELLKAVMAELDPTSQLVEVQWAISISTRALKYLEIYFFRLQRLFEI